MVDTGPLALGLPGCVTLGDLSHLSVPLLPPPCRVSHVSIRAGMSWGQGGQAVDVTLGTPRGRACVLRPARTFPLL
jgi:hypothetical protein